MKDTGDFGETTVEGGGEHSTQDRGNEEKARGFGGLRDTNRRIETHGIFC